jgi:putative oxidoreductase
MERQLERYSREIYALTRIVVGFLFFCHGAQKIFGLFGGAPASMPPVLLWAAGLFALVGGGLIAVGLFTGWAAFICSGLMAVAYFMVHQPRGLLPIQNQGELAAVYSFVFLLIASRGSGIWSVDGVRGG